MYSYIFFGLMMVGIFSIIENMRNGRGFSNIRMYIILFLSFITMNSFLDFLSEFGYDFKLLESIIGLSALISFINLFYFIANRKIPKVVIVLECLIFIFFTTTYIFGYYSTAKTGGNLLIEISLIDRLKFFIKAAFVLISISYNIFIIYRNTDNNNLYQVKIKRWSIFIILLLFISITIQITVLLIYYNKVAIPLFDSRAVVSLVRFVLLLFILFRPKFLNESGYSSKINKIFSTKNNLSVSNFELLFFANTYFLNANANLEDFALKLNKTKGEVNAFIKDQFNDSFSEILNKNRVTYFKELLNSKQYESFTIEALSEMSGFSNRQAMYVAFKKYEGSTPSDYIDNL
jgi:AraC-like DNA-binding protein